MIQLVWYTMLWCSIHVVVLYHCWHHSTNLSMLNVSGKCQLLKHRNQLLLDKRDMISTICLEREFLFVPETLFSCQELLPCVWSIFTHGVMQIRIQELLFLLFVPLESEQCRQKQTVQCELRLCIIDRFWCRPCPSRQEQIWESVKPVRIGYRTYSNQISHLLICILRRNHAATKYNLIRIGTTSSFRKNPISDRVSNLIKLTV